MKIVINKCFGGFGLCKEVMDFLDIEDIIFCTNSSFDITSDNSEAWRADARLIAAIEAVGVEKAGSYYAELKIVEIPEGVDWRIDQYDGMEHIYEVHRCWS